MTAEDPGLAFHANFFRALIHHAAALLPMKNCPELVEEPRQEPIWVKLRKRLTTKFKV